MCVLVRVVVCICVWKCTCVCVCIELPVTESIDSSHGPPPSLPLLYVGYTFTKQLYVNVCPLALLEDH